MKAIIHFGHHKIGSTALQAFFFRNQAALIRAGILYPAVESEGLAHILSQLLDQHPHLADDVRDGLNKAQEMPLSMNAREPHNALAFQMLAQATKGTPPPWHADLPNIRQMGQTIALQLHALHPHTVVLCSEVMSNFGPNHPDLIDRVRNIFPNADHELYCVLRRPDDYLISWHAQRLRFGNKVRPLSGGAALNYTNGIHFDYRKVVEPWVKAFPDAPLRLRNYADVLKAGGSAEDFFDATGLQMPGGMGALGRANQSLPCAAMEIARRANHDLSPENAEAMRHFLLTCHTHISLPANRDVEMFGADLRTALAERFAPIHDWLSVQTNQPAFFPDMDDMIKTRPLPEEEAVARLLKQIDTATLPNDTLRDFIRTLAHHCAA